MTISKGLPNSILRAIIMAPLIILTCASGKQCSRLLPLLARHPNNYRLRLAVNSPTSRERLQAQYPTAEVLQVDLLSPTAVSNLVADANIIYYIGPGFHPQETTMGINMITAAARCHSLSHFIFSSVLNPTLSKMLNHDRKRSVEEHLLESSLNYTILQPGHFMDRYIEMVVSQSDAAKPEYRALWDPTVPISFTSLSDYAEISFKIITEGRPHYYAVYPIVSTLPITYIDFVHKVSTVIGKDVAIRTLDFSTAVDLVCQGMFGGTDIDQRYRDGPERMLLFYHRRGLNGNPTVARMLLGRETTEVEAVAREMRGEIQEKV